MSAPDLWFNRNRKRCISSQRRVGGEKHSSKNDDDGYPPSVLEARLASDRHLPPFRLQYHVCLPTSDDPWFVHQPAGQVVVVSLVVVRGRKSSERQQAYQL